MNAARDERRRRGRDRLVLAAKIAVSAVLIGFVVSRISLSEIRHAVRDPHWGWLAASMAIYAASAVGCAWQWALILRAGGIAAPAREIRRLYFIGLFFNNFLPANVGGDAYKIIDLGRREHRPLAVFCSTLLDRLVGLAALTLLAVVVLGVTWVVHIALPLSVLLLAAVLALLAAVLALLLSRRLGRRLPGWLQAVRLGRFADRAGRVGEEFARFRDRPGWLYGIFLLSLGVQLLRMLTHLAVARGLGFELAADQALQLLVLIPLLALSLTLPVTINGIGLRETVSADLLTYAGLAAPEAVAMEVAAYLVQVLFSLQGGVLLWMGRWTRPPDGGN